MDEDIAIINTNTRTEKIKNFFINKKKKIAISASVIILIIFGYFIWDEIPSIKTLAGALLVIISSIIIFRREVVLKKQVSIPRHE